MLMGSALNAGGQAWQNNYNEGQSQLDYERALEMQGIQQQNQKELNKQGYNQSMDIWNNTNYGAQVAHMKKAGINPGLLYGKGGSGGTTASVSSGGGAGAGGFQGSHRGQMDIKLQSELGLMDAQRKNIEADTDNKTADTGLKGEQKNKIGTEIQNIKASTTNIETRTALMGLEQKEKAISIAKDLMTFNAEVAKTREDWRAIQLDNSIKTEQKEELIRSAMLENAKTIAEIAKKESDVELNEQKVWQLSESMYQLERDITSKVEERSRKLEQGEDKLTIDMFGEEIKKWKAWMDNNMDMKNLKERQKERIWKAGTAVVSSIAGIFGKGGTTVDNTSNVGGYQYQYGN